MPGSSSTVCSRADVLKGNADLHENRTHPLNRIHPGDKNGGTNRVDQCDLGHQHVRRPHRRPPVPVPPASITNLHNTTYQPTTITWNWTDPSSAGYTNARVFLNGVFQADVLKGVQTFTKTGLTPSTAYTLSINTEGPIGLINATMVTNTSTTAPVVPPRFPRQASRTSTTPRTSRHNHLELD